MQVGMKQFITMIGVGVAVATVAMIATTHAVHGVCNVARGVRARFQGAGDDE